MPLTLAEDERAMRRGSRHAALGGSPLMSGDALAEGNQAARDRDVRVTAERPESCARREHALA
jgi:hypothetical protein